MDVYWHGLLLGTCVCDTPDVITDVTSDEDDDVQCTNGVQCTCVRGLPALDCTLSPFTLIDTEFTLLCADRVSQMTKAYHDIDAVSSLLEERVYIWKERDLELAARIGQTLLERNKELENKTSDYEIQLAEANDQLKQLRHDVSKKDALLQVYLHDEDTSPTSPQEEIIDVGVGIVSVDKLRHKVKTLEDENFTLIKQTASLKTETALVEEKEQNIFRDCVKQLENYKDQVLHLQGELILKSDTNLKQQQEITALTEKKVSLEAKNKQIKDELSDITKSLQIAQEVQTELATEISQLENQNEELEVLLHESQGEIKSLKKKQKPSFIRHHSSFHSPFLPQGSLALELEDSVRRDVECPPGYTVRERRQHSKNVMRTARLVRKSQRPLSASSSVIGSSYQSEAELSEGYGADVDSLYGSSLALGRPGLPGSNDLDVALMRLRQGQGDLSRDSDNSSSYMYPEDSVEPNPSCRSPDSMLSLGSMGNMSDLSRVSGASYKIPEKLQIVKPIEGSHTLHNWRRLATPNLAGVLEHRPGIQNKGEIIVDSELEEGYSLSDYEEDDDQSLQLGKCMEQTSGIYTYTTAKILHPTHQPQPRLDDMMSTAAHVTSTVSTPGVSYCKLSGHGGTSTFSMSAGLAHGLKERSTQPPGGSAQRYGNIVTETISSSTQSQTESLYTSAGAGMCVGQAVTSVMISQGERTENAYLQLADKVKDIGLNAILGIANKSGITPIKLNPVDTGLNAIMSIRRNRSGPVNRGLAEQASSTIHYAKSPKLSMNRKEMKARNMMVANSSRVIMASPYPGGCPTDRFTPGASSTPRGGKQREDTELIRTLPSTVVTTTVQTPLRSPRRPDTLAIRPSTLPVDKLNEELQSLCIRNRISVSCDEGEATPTTTGGSGGLFSQLSSIYTRTRDMIAAPRYNNDT